ncbi:MAG TPA: O-antigen ligase family protein [Fimbriimonadaceae bacterium]|nr:O-antigen ligase family protein [Fimbriimonadaceae bacterium]
MAAYSTTASTTERFRTLFRYSEDTKGLILSHLLGFALFNEITLNIFKYDIPLTPTNSIPIRLLAVWLFIDRSNRIGRLRFGAWDCLIAFFVVASGVGMVYTSITAPSVPVDFDNFRRFCGIFLSAYLYYLVAKEGLNRRGFRPDITVYWLVAGFAWSAIVGLLQTANLFHARQWSLIYANRQLDFLRKAGSTVGDASGGNANLASGTAAWWNSMALEMLVAFALVFGSSFLRRPKWFEWMLGLLFMGAFMATESRGGLAAFGACAVATFAWFLYHRRYLVATIIGTTVAVAVIVWLMAVFALKIERFTKTIDPGTVRGSTYSQSFDSRLRQQHDLIDIGLRNPIFGTGPYFPPRNVRIWSVYTITGATDTNYGFTFAQFGLVGLAFLIAVQLYMISFIRSSVAYRPFAFAAFFIGIAFSVHGLVEFLLYGRTFMVMNLLAAYAGSPILVSEKGRAAFRRLLKPARTVTAREGGFVEA